MEIKSLAAVLVAFMGIFLGSAVAKSSLNNPTDLFLTSSTLEGGNIQPGAGCSNDMQQIAYQPCFKVANVSQTAPESILKLDTASSFSQLQNDLKIDVSANGKRLLVIAKLLPIRRRQSPN